MERHIHNRVPNRTNTHGTMALYNQPNRPILPPTTQTVYQHNTTERIPVIPSLPPEVHTVVPSIPNTIQRDNGLVYVRPAGIPERTGNEIRSHNSGPIPTRNDIKPETIPMIPIIPGLTQAPKFPDKNPYLKLPRSVLDAIGRERDIQLLGTNVERAEQLFTLDYIMPDWIESIACKNFNNFSVLTGSKLFVFAALNNIDISEATILTGRELIMYISVNIILVDDKYKNRRDPSLFFEMKDIVFNLLAKRVHINPEYVRFISRRDMIQAILNGNANNINTEPLNALCERYQMLTTCKYKNLLAALYGIRMDNDEDWVKITRGNSDPMEAIIVNFDSYKIEDIIERFEIVVPLAFQYNVKQYVINNLSYYFKIPTRATLTPVSLDILRILRADQAREYLSKLTDKEIHKMIGIYVAYNSRVDLIWNTIDAFRNPCFFYPTVRSRQRSINRETISLTDITDVSVFMIAYGTITKYYTYELDDLLGAFSRDTETKLISFRHPEKPALTFTLESIQGLRQLLSCFPSSEALTAVIDLIDEGIIDERERTVYDNEARQDFSHFDMRERDLIKEFFRQVFFIGMYMRRWKGPGYPYPLKSETTKERIDPDELDEIIKTHIKPATDLLDEMGEKAAIYCLQLRLCEYDAGNIKSSTMRFREEWYGVGSGKNCIRIASSKFIGTSYHYLRVLFRETIPGINMKEVDRIA